MKVSYFIFLFFILNSYNSSNAEESTINEHLSSQPQIDGDAFDANNTKIAHFNRVSSELEKASGIAHIDCWEPAGQLCQDALRKLQTLSTSSIAKDTGITRIWIDERFKEAHYNNDGSTYGVSIDGRATQKQIMDFLKKQKKANPSETIKIKSRVANFDTLSTSIEKNSGIKSVDCWGRGETVCQKGIVSLNEIKADPSLKNKGFTRVWIGNGFENAHYDSNGDYIVSIDGNASPKEVLDFFKKQEKFNADAYDAKNAKIAYYNRVSSEIEKATGIDHIDCWARDERLCQNAISKLESLKTNDAVKSKGFTRIWVGDSFKDAYYDRNGDYIVGIDGNAPLGEILTHLRSPD